VSNYKNSTYLCVIPARGGSKGIPNKNIKDLCDHPLIHYSIKAAIDSSIFDRIVVSTDSFDIAKIAVACGAEVPFLRPDCLATDKAMVEDVIVHLLKHVEKYDKRYDYICLLQPTSPLIEKADIIKANQLLLDKKAVMIVSVGESPINVSWSQEIPEDLSMRNFSFNMCSTNRQCFKGTYFLNGAIYMGKWDIFYNKKNYYEQETYAYKMPYDRSIDIDNEFDFKLAKFLLKERIE